MRHFPKITVTGALLLTLASASYAQSTSTPSTNQNSTVSSPSSTGTVTTSPSSTSSQTTSSTTQSKNMPTTITPDNIQWKDAPSLLPAGAQLAVLRGNPKAKGNFTVRLKLPANYQIQPIYVAAPQTVTVLTGSVNVGLGNKFDTNAGTALPTGSFILVPANKNHYVWTTEESILQISGTGPWTVKYVNAKDDPRKNKATSTQPTPSQSPAPDSITNSQQNSAPSQQSTPTSNY